jgi:hypothetical protein
MTEQAKDIIQVDCTECKRTTSHDVLHSSNVGGSDEDSEIHWGAEYQTVQCRGCATISFAVRSWNSEETDEDGQLITSEVMYPSRTIRKPIENHYYLPNKVRNVYVETLTALSNKAPILAAIGIRAVVEAVCNDKGCTAGVLEQKIDHLVEKGHLATDQAGFLHLQRFMGNAAAHEIAAPKQDELRAALDIAENLLINLYVLPVLAQNMEQSQTELAARRIRVKGNPNPGEKTLT